MRDLYADLGLTNKATQEQIRQAWRAKAVSLHPDRGGDPETFRHTRIAYETLVDPELRAAYDGARAGKVDPKIFQDLFVDMVRRLGPEFVAMRTAAQAGNWLGLLGGGVKIGAASWLMSRVARTLLATSEPQPAHERAPTVHRRNKAIR